MGTVSRMSPLFTILLLVASTIGAPPPDFSDLILNRMNMEDRSINTCGCAAVSGTSRIVGGQEVSPKHKLPYQVLFSPCSKDGACYGCGATILNKRYILTAAHCLYDGSNKAITLKNGGKFRVMAGLHNKCKDEVKMLSVSVVHQHPKWNMDSADIDYDTAILKLSEDLVFSNKIKPACLPTSATKDYSNVASIISGWGGTKAYKVGDLVKQPNQCELKESVVKILSSKDKKCSDFLGQDDSTSRLCALGLGTDTCQGDSGGPLAVAEGGKYVVLGVVSNGQGCAGSTPGVYARVQGFLPWIHNILKDGECGASGKPTTAPATTAATKAPTATTAATKAPTATTTENYDYYNYGQYGLTP